MKHGIEIRGYTGTRAELAEELGNLLYDALAGFFHELAAKIAADGERDAARGRVRLARELRAASAALATAAAHIEAARAVCESHLHRRGQGASAPGSDA